MSLLHPQLFSFIRFETVEKRHSCGISPSSSFVPPGGALRFPVCSPETFLKRDKIDLINNCTLVFGPIVLHTNPVTMGRK